MSISTTTIDAPTTSHTANLNLTHPNLQLNRFNRWYITLGVVCAFLLCPLIPLFCWLRYDRNKRRQNLDSDDEVGQPGKMIKIIDNSQISERDVGRAVGSTPVSGSDNGYRDGKLGNSELADLQWYVDRIFCHNRDYDHLLNITQRALSSYRRPMAIPTNMCIGFYVPRIIEPKQCDATVQHHESLLTKPKSTENTAQPWRIMHRYKDDNDNFAFSDRIHLSLASNKDNLSIMHKHYRSGDKIPKSDVQDNSQYMEIDHLYLD
ncbi:hypothetical protein GJ496_011109 [Pomphorhynchus laevis]|nr:hypothetical protein GJ496_011109 [Pomphorhynchus laevis]